MQPKYSDGLETLLSPYRAAYNQIMNTWVGDRTFGVTYPALLVETYHYVKHSCSLMSDAYARLGEANSEIKTYLEKHIGEETGHEEWLLNDLEQLGFDREAVKTSTPMAETIDLIGSQLYVINYLHPAGLLGYVYVMESQPPSETSLKLLQELFGIRPDAMTFFIRHGEADLKHRVELKFMLDTHFESLPERQAATISAVMGLSGVNRLLNRARSGDFVSWLPPSDLHRQRFRSRAAG
jgi:hypothetical protein